MNMRAQGPILFKQTGVTFRSIWDLIGLLEFSVM